MITSNTRVLTRLAVPAALAGVCVAVAGPASAGNVVDIVTAAPTTVAATYSCDAGAGVVALKAMLGNATADRPAALGAAESITCDGTEQRSVIALVAEPGEVPPQPGGLVQVRIALVDQGDMVVVGQAKVVPMQP